MGLNIAAKIRGFFVAIKLKRELKMLRESLHWIPRFEIDDVVKANMTLKTLRRIHELELKINGLEVE